MAIIKKATIDKSAEVVTEYLREFPKETTIKIKKKKIDPKTKEGAQKIYEKIKNDAEKVIAPNKPTTAPDELTSLVLEQVYAHKNAQRAVIQKHYQNQKRAEMMIGELLERYILSKGEKHGWVFSSTCITSVDFIKKDGKNWITLQVKNSDNTENSSSSKVRDNTTIMKWVRRNSKKGTYYWDTFPDEKLKNELSEKGFRTFVKKHFDGLAKVK